MATVRAGRYLGGLVDSDRGLISREIFVSDWVYEEELEKVFARSWLFVGHESQIPERGDFFVSRMGEESVILCRDGERNVHVFLNSCRHRGMKVCRYDEGNAPVFSCPYHGWSYATNGDLVGVPYFKQAYREQLDKSQWGLIEVPQLANYKGAIFACWDPEAPSFEDYMGDMFLYLDPFLDSVDGKEGGTEVYGGVQKWTIPTNWKFAAENTHDYYHGISHRSADLAGISPSGKGRGEAAGTVGSGTQGQAYRIQLALPGGHGTVRQMPPGDDLPTYRSLYPHLPIVEDYFRKAHEVRNERLGKLARLRTGTALVFPNAFFHGNRTLAVWHPKAALLTEAWRWYFIDKDAPQEVKDAVLHYYLRYSGPGGLTEQDDMENWNYASIASRGTIAKRYPYNYEMGLGFTKPDDELPGNGNDVWITEQNQRALYKAWAHYMEIDDWGELAPALGLLRNGK